MRRKRACLGRRHHNPRGDQPSCRVAGATLRAAAVSAPSRDGLAERAGRKTVIARRDRIRPRAFALLEALQ
jgi:hypothetical protein